jgi:hypothetical protein
MLLLSIVIFLITFSFLGIVIVKEIYLYNQWKKPVNESQKINNQNLSEQELLFELEYLNKEYHRLMSLEKKMFPYL